MPRCLQRPASKRATRHDSARAAEEAVVAASGPHDRRGRGGVRFATLQAVVTALVAVASQWLMPLAGAGLNEVPGGGRGRAVLVFRVEGARSDPEFVRACGVVQGLEDLYGEERYKLQAVPVRKTAHKLVHASTEALLKYTVLIIYLLLLLYFVFVLFM